MSPDEYRSGDPITEVRELARSLDGRFSRKVESEFGPVAAGIVDPEWTVELYYPHPAVTMARDLVDATGVRATLEKHFPHWDLSANPPLFDEALAAMEAVA